jgi:hypothetical protein
MSDLVSNSESLPYWRIFIVDRDEDRSTVPDQESRYFRFHILKFDGTSEPLCDSLYIDG